MIKAIALDDEPLSLEITQNFCNRIDGIDLVASFTSQKKTKTYLQNNAIDLLFLDIEMPELSGLDFYKSINQNLKVIFITAYKEHAVEGFTLNATDYLLKPFSFERFALAIEKVEKELFLEQNFNSENTHLNIRANYQTYNIDFNNILFIEAFDDYIKLHVTNNKIIVARYTMKNILSKLPQHQFVRVHRSYIVALKKIDILKKNQLTIQKHTLPVSNTYKEQLIKLFNN